MRLDEGCHERQLVALAESLERYEQVWRRERVRLRQFKARRSVKR